jgi:hypothetical protein
MIAWRPRWFRSQSRKMRPRALVLADVGGEVSGSASAMARLNRSANSLTSGPIGPNGRAARPHEFPCRRSVAGR